MSASLPTIFSPSRRRAIRLRMRAARQQPDAARYLMDDMVDDVLDRLRFLRHAPQRTLIIGEWTGALARELAVQGCHTTGVAPEEGFDEEAPFPDGGYDFIASLGTLDTVNDLPGALIHIRNALAPGGLMIASFPGAGSLPRLRSAMLATDDDRPAARLHPTVDVRAGGQLLQRAGYANPVVDSRGLDVRFSSLDALVRDLRAQGLTSALSSAAPPLGRAALAKAEEAFMQGAQRATEHFEILTLSGWRA